MQPILDKNDVFLKKAQKCFLQFCPPLQAYSHFFDLLWNATTAKASVPCCGQGVTQRQGWLSQPPPAALTQATSHLAAGQLAWAQPLCNPRHNFSLNIRSLSLLFKTPHTGTKYTTGYCSGLTYRLCLLKWECGQCRRHTNPIKAKAQ